MAASSDDPRDKGLEAPSTDAADTVVGKPTEDEEPTDSTGTLVAGTTAGRYVLLHRLGAGGAGQVFAAFDPELNRKIAIKVLRSGREASPEAHAARMRLLREAQAMARLKHPNVLPVYDVGTLEHDGEERVFLAMELVEGGTLRQWLKQPRSRRQTLEVICAAGRGLAAAHDAGLVHRDFKPENVLIGDDGRICVTDFGLVRAEGDSDPAAAAAPHAPAGESSSPLDTPLTRANAVMGTPGYMAPEQYRGETADARTDQFSFCVTLFEALYGERPFPGRTVGDIRVATLAGKMVEPPRAAGVPRWLERTVLRGLHADRTARYDGMHALLAALAADPAIRRRRWLVRAAIVVAALGAALGVRQVATRKAAVCRGAEERLAGVWDADVRTRIEHALTAAGASALLVRNTTAALDAYGHQFVSMHTDACEATRVRGDQPESLLALRMACLETRRKELGALTNLLQSADRELAEKSVEAVGKLSSLGACSDVALLTAPVPLPADAEVRRKVEDIRSQLADVKALMDAARYKQAAGRTDELLTLAEPLRYDPLRAQLLETRAELYNQEGDSKRQVELLYQALDVAYAGHDDARVAEVATDLGFAASYWLAHHEEARHWLGLAKAAIERLGGSDELEAARARAETEVLINQGKGEDAVAVGEKALALFERAYGLQTIKVAQMHGTLGAAYYAKGDYAAARRQDSLHLSILEQLVGADHPLLAWPLNNLGMAADADGHHDEAERRYRACLALIEKTLGPEHPRVAIALDNLGFTLNELGRHAEALAAFERAVALYDRKFGRDYADAADPLLGVGESLLALKRPREAVPPLERALALAEHGDGDPETAASVRSALARALWDGAGNKARARQLAEQALEELAKGTTPLLRKEADAARKWLAAHR